MRHRVWYQLVSVSLLLTVILAMTQCGQADVAQQVSLLGQCPEPAAIGMRGSTAYRVTMLERQTTMVPLDPVESLRVVFDWRDEVMVYGAGNVPFVHNLMQPEFDVRLVRRKE